MHRRGLCRLVELVPGTSRYCQPSAVLAVIHLSLVGCNLVAVGRLSVLLESGSPAVAVNVRRYDLLDNGSRVEPVAGGHQCGLVVGDNQVVRVFLVARTAHEHQAVH